MGLPEHFSKRPLSRAGFSLVEVVLAIGLLVFGLLAVLGLFSVGHSSSAISNATVHAAGVASHLLAERTSDPMAPQAAGQALPPLGEDTTGSALVDRFGRVAGSMDQAAYRLTWRYQRPAPNSGLRVLTLRVGWPPGAPDSAIEQITVSTAAPVPPE